MQVKNSKNYKTVSKTKNIQKIPELAEVMGHEKHSNIQTVIQSTV